ncbi:hypothetical protein [Amycolatopsis sp. NPDC050768]|uniref:hypothetical protein n=1 Tax=Amycolatopsis sp. NPDC050768 TaxID=3154839 RepID=UPI0033E7B890
MFPRSWIRFVRWPEHYVYARDHGERLGLGTYDHRPLPVTPGESAQQAWVTEQFDPAIATALALLPEATRFTPAERLNGVFSMTPDNLPLLAPVAHVAGLWLAEAIWVTHAAGSAAALAALLRGEDPGVPHLETLRPGRFAGQDGDDLTRRALKRYRDIYATA